MMQNCHIQKTKKIIGLTLCFLFMLLMVLSADGVNDYQDHYAKESIKELFEKGVITGYEDGSFQPDREISRAEFMTIVNRAFDFKEQTEISYSDVKEGEWHYEHVARAVKAGYIKGFTDGTMRPTANITRQEAAVVIARILDIEKDGNIKKLTTLKDGDKVPEWSAQGVAAIVERDYIDLKEDNKFLAAQNLTRADMAIAIVRSQEDAITKLYDKSGTYTGGKIDGNVKIDNKSITLINTEINGDLILGEGIGEGDVRLTNVTVKGDTVVKGGGKNTITLEHCQFEKIIILKEDGKVRILAKGDTKVKQSEVKSGAILESQGKVGEGFGYITIAEDISEGSIVELIGDFKSVEVAGNGIDVKASGGTIENLTIVKGTKDVEIDLAKDAKITALTANSPANITGAGKIEKAKVNVNGVKIEAPVTKLETAPDIEIDIPKKETTPATGGGGGGGGGGGSKGSGGTSTPAKTEVSAISVTGEGGKTTITTKNGTLKMIATVEPTNANNQSVTWSVDKPEIATISSNGLLTAKTDGAVIVTATAQDESGKSGSKEIGIYNQTMGFTSHTKEIPNDQETLGTIGTSVSSLYESVATAIIEDGKVKITSHMAGNTVVNVKSGEVIAAIVVSVAADGSIKIDQINKAEKTIKAIGIANQPKLEYFVGEMVDFSNLILKLVYNDNSYIEVDYNTFINNYNGTISVGHGTQLNHGGNKEVVVKILKPFAAATFYLQITDPNLPEISGTVKIVGNAIFGETLTADTTEVINKGKTPSYQWERDGLAINKATSKDYKLVKEDVGKTITLRLKASLNEGKGSITSSPTGPVDKAQYPRDPHIGTVREDEVTATTIIVRPLNIYIAPELQEISIDGGQTWHECTGESITLTGLTPNNLYKIIARGRETETHYASKNSGYLGIWTKEVEKNRLYFSVIEKSGGFTATVDGQPFTNSGDVYEGSKVVITFTPNNEGEGIISHSLVGIEEKDIVETIPGKEFAFTMPDKYVQFVVSVGSLDRHIMVDGKKVALVNGVLSSDENSNLSKLSWNFFTRTLTMDGFTGNSINWDGISHNLSKIRVKGENTLNINSGSIALYFAEIAIVGQGSSDKLIINSDSRYAINLTKPLTLDNVSLKISHIYKGMSEYSGGIGAGVEIINGGNLEIITENTRTAYKANGVSGELTIEDGSAEIQVKSNGGISVPSGGMPYIGNWASGSRKFSDGVWYGKIDKITKENGTKSKPILISYKVTPETADLLTYEDLTTGGGSVSLIALASDGWELYNSESFSGPVLVGSDIGMRMFSDVNNGIFTAIKGDKHYKIIITKEEIPKP